MECNKVFFSFSKRLYTSIFLGVVLWGSPSGLSAQEACPIYTAIETNPTLKTRSASNYTQFAVVPNSPQWTDIENIAKSDNNYATVSLSSYKKPNALSGSDLRLNIPNGAQVSGLEISIEGHTTGEGRVRDVNLQLLDSEGRPSGNSLAGTGGSKAWFNGESDYIWTYGGINETWDLDLNSTLLNDPDFGFELFVRNSLTSDIDILIDQILVTVYYEPLYSFCDHTCITFYVNDPEETVSYNWLLPQGFELLSLSEKSRIIDIGVSYATFGTHEICVETLTNGSVTGLCCRKFNYLDCISASIGDQVWNDVNPNSIFDSGDEPLAGIDVKLFDIDENLINTVRTDVDGKYQFDISQKGSYYVQVEAPVGYTPVFEGIGNENLDSDITNSFGLYTTGEIALFSDSSINNIDLGFSEALYLGDQVWEDANGDGLYQTTEQGIEGVLVKAVSNHGHEFSTVTDSLGNYAIGPLPQGRYKVIFNSLTGYSPTLINVGTDESIDSDINTTGSTDFALYNQSGSVLNIDAGFYRNGTIGDFIWEDLNNNGIQEIGEPGIANIEIKLLKDNVVVDTKISGPEGGYQFVVTPGVYTLEIEGVEQFRPTLTNVGDPALDSDLFPSEGKYTTNDIVIESGENENNIDLGLYNIPSSIGGIAWLDIDSDGQLDSNEPRLADISVTLYNESGIVITSSTTNSNGEYLFDLLSSDNYFVAFDLENDRLFTTADWGDDSTDSDITSSQISGSTDLINLQPDTDLRSIYAGYVEKADIGDQVWLDLDRDGLYDNNEPGVSNVSVTLVQENGEQVVSTTTDQNGNYHFTNIIPGTYSIQFNIDGELSFTDHNSGSNNNFDSDVISFTTSSDGTKLGTTDSFNVNTNDVISNIDAGLLLRLGDISGKVFLDADENGNSSGESTVAGIDVGLMNEQLEILTITTTDTNGAYQFTELSAGIYYVVFEIEDRFAYTEPNLASDDIDSDVTQAAGDGTTDAIQIVDAVSVEHVDAGIVDGITAISGVSWVDQNGDGIRTPDESFLAGVTVSLHLAGSITPLSETVTNQNGKYIFNDIASGSYYIKFSNSEYIVTIAEQGTNTSLDSDITDQNGVGTTDIFEHIYFSNTLALDAGYYKLATIGDYLWEDVNKNGLQDQDEPGLAGVALSLRSEDLDVLATTTTDANGMYQFTVSPGAYHVTASLDGYVLTTSGVGSANSNSDFKNINGLFLTDLITLSSGQERLDIDGGFVPAAGSLFGLVFLDENENGIDDENSIVPGIDVNLFDENQNLVSTVQTNFDGEYLFNTVAPGNYYLVFEISDRFRFTSPNVGSDDTDSDVSESIVSGSTSLITIANGQNVGNVDAGVILGLATVSGLAWIDTDANGLRTNNEPLLPDVLVEAYNELGQIISSAITGFDGTYIMNDLTSGSYFLVFTTEDGTYLSTTPDVGDDDTIDSDITHNFLPGSTGLITIEYFEEQNNIDAGYYKLATLGDQVWIDSNDDNIRNNGELGLNDVTVNLLNSSNTIVNSTISENDGKYLFENVIPGNYSVQFELPEDYRFVVEHVGTEETDSDVVSVDGSIGTTATITISSDESNLTLDAGVYRDLTFSSSIAGFVWLDGNSDGLSTGESAVEGRTVSLFTATGILVASVQTDADGDYIFTMVDEGEYFVKVDFVGDNISTIPNIGIDDTIDSEFTDENGPGTTTTFNIINLEEKRGLDLGIAKNLSVSGQVWSDTNADGQNNNQENGFEGVTVKIESLTGDLLRTTTTDNSGQYTFSDLPSFMYKITISAPTGTSFTLQNIGNDTSDSDVDQLLGTTINLDFRAGGDVNDVDAGLVVNSSVEGFVWVDVSGNAQLDSNEPRLNNINVSLYDHNGVFIQSTLTTNGPLGPGYYMFEDITFGDYYVEFEIPEIYSVALPNIGDENLDSDITGAQGTQGSTDIFSLGANVSLSYISAGIYLPSSLGDRVFLDENKNGIQDDNEAGVEGVEVMLYPISGSAIDTVYTDESGYYGFENVAAGQYFIEFIVPQQYVVSPINQGGDDSLDSDADPTGTSFVISLAHGAKVTNIDIGIYEESTSLRSTVWLDENADGLRQEKESRLASMFVKLLDEQKNIVDWTFSNELGKYGFEQLENGNYYIHIETSNLAFLITEPNSSDNLLNNDLLYSGYSEMFSVNDGLSVPNVDAGMLMPSTIKVEVWEENEIDGFLNEDELPLENIMAELIDQNGTVCAMKMSGKDEFENVTFEKVRPGNYHLRYTNDYDYIPSLSGQTDIVNPDNSDIIESAGYYVSPSFDIGIEETIDYVDAGFFLDANKTTTKHHDEEIKSDDGLEFNIGPNPAMFYIELTNKKDSKDQMFEISLADREGKIVYQNTVQNPQNYRIPIAEYKSGMYYLVITNGQETISSSLLKITP